MSSSPIVEDLPPRRQPCSRSEGWSVGRSVSAAYLLPLPGIAERICYPSVRSLRDGGASTRWPLGQDYAPAFLRDRANVPQKPPAFLSDRGEPIGAIGPARFM